MVESTLMAIIMVAGIVLVAIGLIGVQYRGRTSNKNSKDE